MLAGRIWPRAEVQGWRLTNSESYAVDTVYSNSQKRKEAKRWALRTQSFVAGKYKVDILKSVRRAQLDFKKAAEPSELMLQIENKASRQEPIESRCSFHSTSNMDWQHSIISQRTSASSG